MFTLSFTNGHREEQHTSVREACIALLGHYPDAVFYSCFNFQVDPHFPEPIIPIFGRVWLAWATGEDSTGDDGSHAVAELKVEEGESNV